jgi:LmbE family N-acetylglucosaminyl deacetylase
MFLGFPDEGMCYIASQRGLSRARAFESLYTKRYEPPASERLVLGAEYRDADVREELRLIVTGFQPTVVALPTPDDDHPDHGASGILAFEALDAAGRVGKRLPAVLEYLVHHDRWPDLAEDPDSRMMPPADFAPAGGEWRSLALTPPEIAAKRRALAAYPSQALVIGSFMRAFGRPNELFITGRTSTHSECWCDAEHVATEADARPPAARHRHTVQKS